MIGINEMEALLRDARRIAVLGIKPEHRREQAAFWIPEYMAIAGYEIIPVPTWYPEVDTILGREVARDLGVLRDHPPDLVNVFLRPEQVQGWASQLLTLGVPVWFQSGCLHEPTAAPLGDAGIEVAHDCIGCRHAAMLEGPGRRRGAQLGRT